MIKPRLYGILALTAPTVVIFWQGPGRVAGLVRWNLEDDSIDFGDSMRGKIFEREADVSPSGEFAAFVSVRLDQHNIGFSACVTRVPGLSPVLSSRVGVKDLTAGFFCGDNRFSTHLHELSCSAPELPFKVDADVSMPVNGESPEIERMQRTGWTIEENIVTATGPEESFSQSDFKSPRALGGAFKKAYRYVAGHSTLKPRILSKRAGEFALERIDSLVAHHLEVRYRVRALNGSLSIDLPGFEWVDVDRSGQLLLARDSAIYRGTLERFPSIKLERVADLMSPQFKSFQN